MSSTVEVNVSFIPKQYISWYIDFICGYRKVKEHNALFENELLLVGLLHTQNKQIGGTGTITSLDLVDEL